MLLLVFLLYLSCLLNNSEGNLGQLLYLSDCGDVALLIAVISKCSLTTSRDIFKEGCRGSLLHAIYLSPAVEESDGRTPPWSEDR